MEFTEEELKFIQEKRPELIKKPEPTLNTAIVAFLKKYEVAVQPPKDTSKRDRVITGAVTGIAGADVGGDAFLISGQKKQTQVQEWTQWKQWALDHKEFPKFQTDFFNEITAHNQKIDMKLEDPPTQKELDFLIKKYSISESIRNYINPVYLYLKYQKNYKGKKEIKSSKKYKPLWMLLIFVLSIVLIIFVF